MTGIEQLSAITDPVERAREAGRRLSAIPDFQAQLRKIRQEAVLEMRGKGLTFAEIGVELGIHRNRVQQIAEGRPGGGKGGGATVERLSE